MMHSTKRVKMQLLPLHDHPELMPAVCTMLNNQWPRSDTARIMWLRGSTPTLPTSYVLVDTEHNVLGHARVAASLRVGGTTSGISGIVTSVIIHPEHRRKGMGRSLLSLVEACCRHRFGRVVLWTSDQVSFYESCGYVKCSPLRVVSSAASKLDAKGLSALETMLKMRRSPPVLSKQNYSLPSSTPLSTPTTLELSEEDTGDGVDSITCTWLSKRVIEHFPVYLMERNVVSADVRTQLTRQLSPSLSSSGGAALLVLLLDVPNEQQIGPCCGLSAMRCVSEYWRRQRQGSEEENAVEKMETERGRNMLDSMIHHDPAEVLHECRSVPSFDQENKQEKEPAMATTETSSNSIHNVVEYRPNVSMLNTAMERGWTIDGEMFNTIQMAMMAANPCGMAACVYKTMSVMRLVELITRGVPILVPFDKTQSQNQGKEKILYSCVGRTVIYLCFIKSYSLFFFLFPLCFFCIQTNPEHVVSTTTNGKRAHWGIIRGVVGHRSTVARGDVFSVEWAEQAVARKEELLPEVNIFWYKGREEEGNCVRVEEKENNEEEDTTLFDNEKEIFVVLQHTTHGKVCVVPFATLVTSNACVDDCMTSDDRNIGWIETHRQLANTWLVLVPPRDI